MSRSHCAITHDRQVREYAKHHNRVQTWLYDTRRLWIAGLLVAPLIALLAVAVPVLFWSIIMIWFVVTAVHYVPTKGSREE